MRPGVVAERESRLPPGGEDSVAPGIGFGEAAVDEAVDAADSRRLQRSDDLLSDVEPGLTRRQRSVDRQIVEGEGDFRRLLGAGEGGNGDGGEKDRKQATDKAGHATLLASARTGDKRRRVKLSSPQAHFPPRRGWLEARAAR